ncbi:hypothetical protein BHAOGJBA_1312 [Methylobacterium hispanicum]|uniref:Uncharacterized protein n=1 Tax=Methylobacterium hispanicum TaxID=270350 RepID=A0AAV4ZHY7_9HYPH|nr:hypothetical protein BHAOGJBA_1312 [Methylobacterium hispanicum]
MMTSIMAAVAIWMVLAPVRASEPGAQAVAEAWLWDGSRIVCGEVPGGKPACRHIRRH